MSAQPTRNSIRGLVVGVFVVVLGVAAYQLFAHGTAMKAPGAEVSMMPAPEATPEPEPQLGSDTPAPGLELKDVTGKTVRLSDFAGKVVVLNFWATWCPPCRKEIPGFMELQKEYGPKGVQFVGVALDEEGLAKVKPYVEKNPFNYPVLIGDAKGVARYGEMNAIPVTYIIDRKGLIRFSRVGMVDKSVLLEKINPLLAEGSGVSRPSSPTKGQ